MPVSQLSTANFARLRRQCQLGFKALAGILVFINTEVRHGRNGTRTDGGLDYHHSSVVAVRHVNRALLCWAYGSAPGFGGAGAGYPVALFLVVVTASRPLAGAPTDPRLMIGG